MLGGRQRDLEASDDRGRPPGPRGQRLSATARRCLLPFHCARRRPFPGRLKKYRLARARSPPPKQGSENQVRMTPRRPEERAEPAGTPRGLDRVLGCSDRKSRRAGGCRAATHAAAVHSRRRDRPQRLSARVRQRLTPRRRPARWASRRPRVRRRPPRRYACSLAVAFARLRAERPARAAPRRHRRRGGCCRSDLAEAVTHGPAARRRNEHWLRCPCDAPRAHLPPGRSRRRGTRRGKHRSRCIPRD